MELVLIDFFLIFKIAINIRQKSVKICVDSCPDKKIGKDLFESSN